MPELSVGTRITTTQPGNGAWTQNAKEGRKWGVPGRIVRILDQGVLYYHVRLEGEPSLTPYDAGELVVVKGS